MTVKRANDLVQQLTRIVDVLDVELKKAEEGKKVTISESVANDLIMMCEDYRSVILGSDVIVPFLSNKEGN